MPFKIAVVTPYYQETLEMLRQCHDSVINQSIEAHHFMVADGHARPEINNWNARHIALPVSHNDNGNTPRSVGSLLADAEGYDFIAYLDADNWYHPEHLSSLIALWQSVKTPAVTSFRTLHRWDGTLLNITEPAEDKLLHIDTSCLLLHRDAFHIANVWHRMPRQLSPICDRVMLAALIHGQLQVTSSLLRTVAFRTQYQNHYLAAGEAAPEGSKSGVVKPCIEYLQSFQGVSCSLSQLKFWPLMYLNKSWIKSKQDVAKAMK